ncbi:MAG: hypothetical protein ACLRZG_05135 [Streptococcus sp.]
MQRCKACVRKGAEHQQVILAFSHTLHDRHFLAQANIFDQGKEAEYGGPYQEIYQSVDNYREAVAQQIAQSSSVEPAVFQLACKKG